MSYELYTDLSLNGNEIKNVAAGTTTGSVATKGYVDGEIDAAVAAIDLSGYTTDAEHTTEVNARTTDDLALHARLDAISLVGTGMVTTSEAGDNTWTVNVDALQLANTYTGTTGVDSETINADLTAQSVTAAAGDLYINSTSGAAFINTGLEAPGDWVQLAAADVGINSIGSTGGSIAVTGGSGPAANVEVSSALQDAISASTAANTAQDSRLSAIEAVNTTQSTDIDAVEASVTALDGRVAAVEAVNATQDTRIGANETANATQDGRLSALETGQGTQDAAISANTTKNTEQDGKITALETASHAAASGNAAISVDGAQVVSLTIDPASSTALTQSATGLKLDTAALSGVTKKFKGTADLSTSATATVTHNLGTTDVIVQTSVATGQVGLDVTATDPNTVTVAAKTANAALAAVSVVVVG